VFALRGVRSADKREGKNGLTSDEKHTLLVLNYILGGVLFTSDNLRRYSGAMNRLYEAQFPIKQVEGLTVGERGVDVFVLRFTVEGHGHVVYFNFGDDSVDLRVDDGEWISGLGGDGGHVVRLRPHETKCFVCGPGGELALNSHSRHLFGAFGDGCSSQ